MEAKAEDLNLEKLEISAADEVDDEVEEQHVVVSEDEQQLNISNIVDEDSTTPSTNNGDLIQILALLDGYHTKQQQEGHVTWKNCLWSLYKAQRQLQSSSTTSYGAPAPSLLETSSIVFREPTKELEAQLVIRFDNKQGCQWIRMDDGDDNNIDDSSTTEQKQPLSEEDVVPIDTPCETTTLGLRKRKNRNKQQKEFSSNATTVLVEEEEEEEEEEEDHANQQDSSSPSPPSGSHRHQHYQDIQRQLGLSSVGIAGVRTRDLLMVQEQAETTLQHYIEAATLVAQMQTTLRQQEK